MKFKQIYTSNPRATGSCCLLHGLLRCGHYPQIPLRTMLNILPGGRCQWWIHWHVYRFICRFEYFSSEWFPIIISFIRRAWYHIYQIQFLCFFFQSHPSIILNEGRRSKWSYKITQNYLYEHTNCFDLIIFTDNLVTGIFGCRPEIITYPLMYSCSVTFTRCRLRYQHVEVTEHSGSVALILTNNVCYGPFFESYCPKFDILLIYYLTIELMAAHAST